MKIIRGDLINARLIYSFSVLRSMYYVEGLKGLLLYKARRQFRNSFA